MDRDDQHKPRRKGAALVVALVLIIVAVIFVGYNLFYVARGG